VSNASILAYLPSPSANGVSIGALRLHVYGLLIAAGILAAVWMAQRQWTRIGGRLGTMATLAVWGVPGGLIGARVYSLATSWQIDTNGQLIRALEVWRGGLGIWGGIAGGVATGLYGAHRHRLPYRPLLDSVAPALPLAQAIGRWGNYFNQELYGRRTTLPWGIHIDGQPGHYQPTFLYESIWDLIVVGMVLYAIDHFRIRRGYAFTIYVAGYTFGRFFTEYLRSDPAHRFYGLRLNDWTSIILFVLALGLLAWRGRAHPGDDLAGAPLPGTTLGSVSEMAETGASNEEASENNVASQAAPASGDPSAVAAAPDETDDAIDQGSGPERPASRRPTWTVVVGRAGHTQVAHPRRQIADAHGCDPLGRGPTYVLDRETDPAGLDGCQQRP
jgi:prolipoprotein diacylglyceryl transferase